MSVSQPAVHHVSRTLKKVRPSRKLASEEADAHIPMTSGASLEFVPARRPEAVRMDVTNYKLIKPHGSALSKRLRSKLSANEGSDNEEGRSDEIESESYGEEEEKSVDESSDSMEDSEKSDTEDSSFEEETPSALSTTQPDVDEKLFYDINENSNDKGTRAPKRIHKSWHGSARAPVGLVNRGVTCYINSAIQALLHLPAVGRYLLEVLHGSHSKVSKCSVTYDLANLFRKMTEKKSPILPSRILRRLDDINPMLDEWQQEDSHEFYMSLLSRLQEDSVPKGEKLRGSIMHDIFGGSVEQRVTCQSCHTVSTTTQDFYDLPVGFSSHEEDTKYTLESSIRDFFTPETIVLSENGSGYQCEKCRKRTNAVKQLAIAEAPEYLTVHIKRFKMDEGVSKKVKETMIYPRNIDLTRYETLPNDPLHYKLIAVIVHEGRTVSSGHYIALTLQPNNSWMMYDDDLMREISASSAESHPSAYILLYSRLLKRPESEQDANHQGLNSVHKQVTPPGLGSPKSKRAKKSQKAVIPSPTSPKKKPAPKTRKNPRKPSISIGDKLHASFSKRKVSADSIDDIFSKKKKSKKHHRHSSAT